MKNFIETSRNDVQLPAGKAIVSKQSYTIEGLGDFEIKEATIARDGGYYVILGQAFSPDTLEDLESDFDKVFQGFGILT